MTLTKKERQSIYDKSGGHCWYCGCKLVKGWHVDHFKPVCRYSEGMDNPENDVIENMVPACAKCNLFKATFSIEDFRSELELQIERARSYSVNFRTAERFRLVKVINEPVIFWFERQN